MMSNQLGDNPDLDQVIRDAKYARLEFVRKNIRSFAYGSSLLGLLCAFAIAVLVVGGANRDQEASTTLISHATKVIDKHP